MIKRRVSLRRQDLVDLAVPLLVVHVLSVVSWTLASVTTRRLRGDGFRALQFAGIFGWLSWDGGFYRVIALHGYPASQGEAIRFFPLYPGLARLLSPFVAGNTDLALLIVAKVALVAAVVGLHRLVRTELGASTLPTTAVWVLVLFPGAFVLTWGYSEALLLALAIWSFVALRSGRFAWAALLGIAAGMCRPIGIALIAAALIEALRDVKRASLRERASRLAAVIAPAVGMGIFLLYSASTRHDLWLPLSIQDEFRNTEDPFRRLLSLPGQIVGADALKSGLHAPFAVAFVVLAVLVFMRLPASYGAFTTVVLAMALSAQNLNSLERYGMSAFPLSIVVAQLIDRRPQLKAAGLAFGGAAFAGLCTLALVGAYVP